MDKIAEFDDNNGFNVALTSEKIYITSVGREETFALRSVSGVGLYDDIKKYNQELKDFEGKVKGKKRLAYFLIGFGILYMAVTIIYLNLSTIGLVFGGAFFIFGIFLLSRSESAKKPVLDSYFNLMLSGGDRQFPFNKSSKNAKQIALFVNKVEDTLTAYNKA